MLPNYADHSSYPLLVEGVVEMVQKHLEARLVCWSALFLHHRDTFLPNIDGKFCIWSERVESDCPILINSSPISFAAFCISADILSVCIHTVCDVSSSFISSIRDTKGTGEVSVASCWSTA